MPLRAQRPFQVRLPCRSPPFTISGVVAVPSLPERIGLLDNFQAVRAAEQFVRELATTASDMPAEAGDLEQLDSEAREALRIAFPELGDAVASASAEAMDPTSRGQLARNFLLASAELSPEDEWLQQTLERGVEAGESEDVLPAAVPPVLLVAGIVLLLQLKFDISYEQENGKRRLRVAVQKRPTSERLIKKVLGWVG
jgi:hypothetical protein